MKFVRLGASNLEVSHVCLGTMTWGRQNSEAEGHDQMDYAVDQGINFFDTAEIYAVPPNKDTYGKTEKIVGTWFEKSGKREDIILMTKCAGPSFPYIRGGNNKISGQDIRAAVEGSLKRLKTDYIDVYQLHWPNRMHPHFGKHWPEMVVPHLSTDVAKKEEETLLEVLQTIQDFVKQGKVRHFGLSDDTPWGLMKYQELARTHDLPPIVSIQNEFSLLHRKDDPYLAEVCVMEDIAYLPWSPLAGGALSGKYLGGARPEGSRWGIDERKLFRDTETSNAAIAAYKKVAEKHGLDLCQMALAWCRDQSFVTSTIIGATSMEQLKSNIAAFDLVLNEDVRSDIEGVFKQYPIPF